MGLVRQKCVEENIVGAVLQEESNVVKFDQ